MLVANRPQSPAAIRIDHGAIFVSMELSKSTWLVTSLSPGTGMSLKPLGTPKPGRGATKKGDRATLEAFYAELKLPEAQAAAARMRDLAAEKPSALLCFERDPHGPPHFVAGCGR